MPQYRNPDGGLGSANFASRVRRSQESTIKSAKKTTSFNDFFIPSMIGLGTGFRAGGQILAGIEYGRVGKFNVAQLERDISQLKLSTELGIRSFDRGARKLEGEQETAIATSGFAKSGSIVDLIADTQMQLAIQRSEQIRVAREKESALRTQQKLTARQAKANRLGSFIGAAESVAGGAFKFLEQL